MKGFLFGSICAALLFAFGCDDSSGPSSGGGTDGWIIGDNSGDVPTILHTSDGSSWGYQGTDLYVPGGECSSISAVNSQVCWAAGGFSEGFGVVMKTTDGGETWRRMGNESEIPEGLLCVKGFSEDVAWVAGQDNAVYITTDGGVSWQDASDPFYDHYTWQGISALSSTSIWLCGGDGAQGACIHTGNGGVFWTLHTDSILTGRDLISIAAYDNENVWAVGHGYTVVKSTDGGLAWEMVTPDSMEVGAMNDANGLTLLSPWDAWVVMDYGNIWRTLDGGISWTQQPVGTYGGFFMLRISAVDENTAWVTGHSSFGTPEGIILHTTDGGSSWVRQDDGNVPGLWDVSVVGEYN